MSAKFRDKIASWGGQWLSKAGKLILIKSILSALPVFQSTLLLAPKAVSAQLSKLMRDFLWNGGKGGQRNMHLVRWEVLKRPTADGGLQIRDPGLANLAMVGKLVWRLFEDPKHPVSKIFRMKYLHGVSLRNISSKNSSSGSGIWNSCRKCLAFFKQNLYKIPGNGMKTLLWEDSISGTPSFSSDSQLHDLMFWFKNQGLNRLADICKWDLEGNWSGWIFPELPVHLSAQKLYLSSLLTGLAPVHISSKDRWGWGAEGSYTAKSAFLSLMLVHNSTFPPAIWH